LMITRTTMNGSNSNSSSSSNSTTSKCTCDSLISPHSVVPLILTSDMTSRNTILTIYLNIRNFMNSTHPCTMNHFHFRLIHLNPITLAIPNQLNSRIPPLSFHHNLASLPILFMGIIILVSSLRELVVQFLSNTQMMPLAKRHSTSDDVASTATLQSRLHGVARRSTLARLSATSAVSMNVLTYVPDPCALMSSGQVEKRVNPAKKKLLNLLLLPVRLTSRRSRESMVSQDVVQFQVVRQAVAEPATGMIMYPCIRRSLLPLALSLVLLQAIHHLPLQRSPFRAARRAHLSTLALRVQFASRMRH